MHLFDGMPLGKWLPDNLKTNKAPLFFKNDTTKKHFQVV